MSVTRTFIQSASIAKTQVNALYGSTTEFELSKEDDQVYFQTDWPNVTFRKADYALVQSAGGCEEITISFEENCGGTWIERYRGTFTQYDEKVDENECSAEVKPVTSDVYTCIFTGWELEKVVFTASLPITTQNIQGIYQAPSALCCQQCYAVGLFPTLPICSVPANYCWTGENYDQGINPIACGNFTDHRFRTCFHRVLGTGTGISPPLYSSGWTYLSGTDWWRCPTKEELAVGLFEHGRLFNSILTYLVGQMFCGLTVRSHFFNINATHAAPPANTPYDYATANLQNMSVHQKSDVKRPFDDSPAESLVWNMTLKKLLNDLRTIFNVYWKIIGTDLIIEHITYFAATTGLNIATKDIILQYGKADNGAPKTEFYFWMDRAGFFEAFQGRPIEYTCGNKGVEHQVNLFDTDLRSIRNTDNAESIKDIGFVLIANTVESFKYYVIGNNEVLGFAALHENLHRDYRYFLDGKMNNVVTTFNSTRKTRELEPFELDLCCNETFNPENEIMTKIGLVSPQKVTIDYSSGSNSKTLTITAAI